MIFELYNDFEIIHLIQTEHDEKAINILLEKYGVMAKKKIREHHLSFKDYSEDLFQECLMRIYDSAMIFKAEDNCSFYYFIDLVLDRYLWKFAKRQREKERVITAYFDSTRDIVSNNTSYEDIIEMYDLLKRCNSYLYESFDEIDKEIYREAIVGEKNCHRLVRDGLSYYEILTRKRRIILKLRNKFFIDIKKV